MATKKKPVISGLKRQKTRAAQLAAAEKKALGIKPKPKARPKPKAKKKAVRKSVKDDFWGS
ncbi:unnamed protein product [marine sediment metagenome]|uniref:Uncharacterized protein n=1 Tax=marine sediment metagenome TaxID=412755 RepID=X0VRP2_9ZZZZ